MKKKKTVLVLGTDQGINFSDAMNKCRAVDDAIIRNVLNTEAEKVDKDIMNGKDQRET